jgi:low temperature requirement protein LtrA
MEATVSPVAGGSTGLSRPRPQAGRYGGAVVGLRTLDVGRLRGRAVTRDPDESDRASTPLELFFDLTFVVAVARASAALDHELVEGNVADGVLGFVGVFFAVWWAWMNATWFASAHDADDVPYRLLMLVQMAGVLVVATGVTEALEDGDWLVVTVGYAIMRVGLATSWLRVARDEEAGRTRALRYAAGISVLQLFWFARLALPEDAAFVGFLVLVAAELAVPLWAERAAGTPVFHPGHIEERYGLFTIIVLGESVLSAATGFQTALDAGGLTADLFAVGVGGLVLAFTAWWIYFDHPGHLRPSTDVAFRWGYAHVVIFAALAAMGAGLQVATQAITGHGDPRTAALAVAVPVGLYLLGLVIVMVVTGTPLSDERVYPKLGGATAVLVIGALAPVGVTVAGSAAVMTVLATWMVLTDGGPRRPAPDVAVTPDEVAPGSSPGDGGRVPYGGGP